MSQKKNRPRRSSIQNKLEEYVRAANHIVNQHLFDTQDDKNVYFGSCRCIINIERSSALDKVAHVNSYTDYSFSPKEHREL